MDFICPFCGATFRFYDDSLTMEDIEGCTTIVLSAILLFLLRMAFLLMRSKLLPRKFLSMLAIVSKKKISTILNNHTAYMPL